MCGGSRDDLSYFSDVHPHSVVPDSPVELLCSTTEVAGDDLSKPGISISVFMEDLSRAIVKKASQKQDGKDDDNTIFIARSTLVVN